MQTTSVNEATLGAGPTKTLNIIGTLWLFQRPNQTNRILDLGCLGTFSQKRIKLIPLTTSAWPSVQWANLNLRNRIPILPRFRYTMSYIYTFPQRVCWATWSDEGGGGHELTLFAQFCLRTAMNTDHNSQTHDLSWLLSPVRGRAGCPPVYRMFCQDFEHAVQVSVHTGPNICISYVLTSGLWLNEFQHWLQQHTCHNKLY